MKRLNVLLGLFFLSLYFNLYGQVSISTTGNNPDASSMLDIQATDKGLLIPRMTTAQRDAISNPANSLLIFNTTTECFEWYHASSGQWIQISCGCTPPSSPAANAATGVSSTGFTANWSASSGATGYYLDVATDAGFTNYVPGYQNLNAGNVTSYNVTGLSCNTTYYYRVRAYNSCGTSGNSNTISVTTGACGPSCGSQVWMAANMDVGIMINDPAEQNNDSQVEKYCYNNTASNCATYGGLYQWAEAIQAPYSANSSSYTGSWATCDPCGSGGIQGICPAGYHIPTDLEFSRYEWCVEATISPAGSTPLSTFQTTAGWRGTNSAAGPGHKMKVTSSNTPSWDGSNASGFSALPAGYRNNGGGFNTLGSRATFWTATEYSAPYAWYRTLYTGYFQSSRNYPNKTYGFSVRCLQN